MPLFALTLFFSVAHGASADGTLTCSSDLLGNNTSAGPNDLGNYSCGAPLSGLAQANGEDVWEFTCQGTGTVEVVLDNMGADYDIYVLDDTCDPTLGCVEGNTAASINTDSLSFLCLAGSTYYIVIEDTVGVGGNYDVFFADNTGGCLEDCDDGIDNDLDGPIDCADSDCFGDPACLSVEFVCDDGVDNDSDGPIDCADSDCTGDPACTGPSEICDDGVDNDLDGPIDCADSDCVGDPACAPPAEVCDDGVDNDADALVDCMDPDCALAAPCLGTCGGAPVQSTLSCSSDLLNNVVTAAPPSALGAYSCGAPASGLAQAGAEHVYTFVPQGTGTVSFFLDNMTADFDIYLLDDTCDPAGACLQGNTAPSVNTDSLNFLAVAGTTYALVIEDPNGLGGQYDLYFSDNTGGCLEDCDDGIDNDLDGPIDCADADCMADPACVVAEICDNGIDDDLDGPVDCSDSDCVADPACAVCGGVGPDTDGDGLSDTEEVVWGTDPYAADTDVDGLLDGDEACSWGTDPLLADTDGEGLLDGDEVLVWGTDPWRPDTDGGGISDFEETVRGTDPLAQLDDQPLLIDAPFPAVAGLTNRVLLAYAAPGANVVLMLGTPGTTAVPSCPGVQLSLGSPRNLGSTVANGVGDGMWGFGIPVGQAGNTHLLQAIDTTTCTLSNVRVTLWQ